VNWEKLRKGTLTWLMQEKRIRKEERTRSVNCET
jgi:hypothetical protein